MYERISVLSGFYKLPPTRFCVQRRGATRPTMSMMMSVAPSVANCLLLQQAHVPTTTHVRNPSQLYSNMEPLYAQVQRKPRNTPEDRQSNSLEAFYGGKELSNGAAFIIQRAFRAYRLRKQFSKLLSVALRQEDKNEVNVDTGLPVASVKLPEPSPVPDNIDLLILHAAGLETFSSIANKSGRNKRDFRRTQSFKVPKSKRMDLEDQGPGPVPAPCPALKGTYSAPKPPQRTVSFLGRPNLPNKVSGCQQRPLPPPPVPVMAASSDGIYVQHSHFSNVQPHLRSYSSPAPLLSPQHIEIPKDDEPLPPPPYISPPLPSANAVPSTPSPPPPPPPPEFSSDSDDKTTMQAPRPPCDSSSSASSIDSGFR